MFTVDYFICIIMDCVIQSPVSRTLHEIHPFRYYFILVNLSRCVITQVCACVCVCLWELLTMLAAPFKFIMWKCGRNNSHFFRLCGFSGRQNFQLFYLNRGKKVFIFIARGCSLAWCGESSATNYTHFFYLFFSFCLVSLPYWEHTQLYILGEEFVIPMPPICSPNKLN